MKKRLTFITFLMLFCSTVFGQSHWGTPGKYENNMSLLGIVHINGVEQKSGDLEIAAFCGDQLRGVTVPFEVDLGNETIFPFMLTIGSNTQHEIIEFKVYDPNAENGEGKEYGSDYKVTFKKDETIGSEQSLEVINFVPKYWNENEVVNYGNTMVIGAIITIDGVSQDHRADLEVAAFCGNELRGVTRPYFEVSTNTYMIDLHVQGEGVENKIETIHFELYDHSGNIDVELLPLQSDYTVDFVDNGTIGIINLNFVYQSVAKVGETYYTTLAAAVEAAQPDETIELINNAKGNGIIINKSLTIDFGGFMYTFVSPAVGSTGTQTQGFQILKDNTVNLKNGTLNVAETAGEDFAMLIQNYADLTITDMTLDGDHLDRNNYSYVLSVNCGDVLIDGSTSILANKVVGENHFAFDSYDYSAGGYTELPVVTINTTGDIKGAVEVSATLKIEALGEGSEISYISIDGKGQLFHNGLTTNIKKHIKGTEAEGWYTISSPVGTVDHDDVVGLLNGTHDLYYYNEVEMMWENVKDTEDNTYTELKNGQGYLYANTLDTDLLFNGPLNTAAVAYSISYTEGNSLAGFNLIGNPFTYNITKSNMSGANLAEGFYTLSNQGAWQANAESATIAPMQGALIKATETTVNFTIAPNSAKRSGSENNGQIKIEVSNGNYNDVAYVSFNKGIGLDKIEHRNANIPMVYVPVDGVNYAVAMMSQDVTEIPVSFQAATMGQYTIGVEAQDCEYAMMTLVDRFTGIETNLLLEDYTFIAKSNDSAERFIIKLAMDNSNGEANENFAFINNGMMYIYNIEGQGTVSVYDVTGRPVAEYNVATSANISTSDFAAGMYIIRMSDENGVKVQKIVVE